MNVFGVIGCKILLVIILVYLCFGMIPLYLSKLHGDYPGSKVIYSNPQVSENGCDFLFIHGASLDARVWKKVITDNKDKSIAAISLSGHQNGVAEANPVTAGQDLVNYLKKHKVNKAIVGHSTASLWIAEAYSQCPQCFEHLHIILLAPSFGNNINPNDLKKLKLLDKMKLFLPEPMLNLGEISACAGSNLPGAYAACKKTYTYGRLFLFNSLRYYDALVNYSLEAETIHKLDYFLQNNHKNIIIYIAAQDQVLNADLTIATAKKYQIKYQVIPNLSHIGLINDYPVWLDTQLNSK
jgi:pimeloyl-ACP methyl ester carboxylesterase